MELVNERAPSLLRPSQEKWGGLAQIQHVTTGAHA